MPDGEQKRRPTQSSDALAQPLQRGPSHRWHSDPEFFGRVSEGVARYIGSWSFIAWMTLLITGWVAFNIFGPRDLVPDPYPFIFLVLLLSLQASYAAPLILLAQNRQADRDRVQYTEDRDRTERLVEDTEFLMREIAALRTALGEVATRDFVRGEFRDLLAELPAELAAATDEAAGDPPAGTRRRKSPPNRNAGRR